MNNSENKFEIVPKVLPVPQKPKLAFGYGPCQRFVFKSGHQWRPLGLFQLGGFVAKAVWFGLVWSGLVRFGPVPSAGQTGFYRSSLSSLRFWSRHPPPAIGPSFPILRELCVTVL